MVVWAWSLCSLWAWAFDSSGGSTLVTLAAAMFALAATVSVPLRLSRIAHWFAVRLRSGDVAALELLASRYRPAGQVRLRAIKRALSITVMFALVCGVAGTIAVYGGARAAYVLGRRMLWTPLGWTGLKLVVQFVGMLPMAAGISAVAHAFSVVRRSFGRDPYGELCRDWLWAMTVGTGLFGLLWWWGIHMLGLAAVMGMLLPVAMTALSRRGDIRISGRGPVERSCRQWRQRTAISVTLAALALILLVQGRLLGDIANVSLGLRVCFGGLSLALLAIFLRGVDRKPRPPGEAQERGAAIGAVAVVMIQAAFAVACCQGGAVAVVCGALAAACQVPLMALGAVVLSRRRRLFAAAGGGFGAYVSCASAGAGIGVVIYMIVCSLPAGPIVLPAAAVAACAGSVICGVARGQKPANKRMWALWTVTLMGAVAGALLVSVHDAKPAVGRATPGFWLTAVRRGGEQAGCLPILRMWRSERITEAIVKIMADPDDRTGQRGHIGRWWVVANGRRDLPNVLNRRVYEVASVADPAAVPPGIWRDILVRGSERDFLQATHTGGELFDGVFLAPLPADHNQAWRCYNYRTLRRCRKRVHPGGVVLLRTQAGGDNLAAALAVAKTFHRAVGASWAVMELHEGMVDLLLVGPVGAVAWPSWREGLTAVPTEKLSADWGEISPIRLARPSGRRNGRQPSEGRLRYWLRGAAAR